MIGEIYALGAAFSFAFNNVFTQRGLRDGRPEVCALIGNVLSTGIFSVITLVLWLTDRLPPLNWHGVVLFAAAGVFTTGLGRLAEVWSISLVGANRTSSIRTLDPLFAYALAIAFLGDHLQLQPVLGILAIVTGLHVLSGDRKPATEARTAPKPDRTYLIGLAMAVICSILFAIGNIFRKAGIIVVPSAAVGSLIAASVGLAMNLVAVLRRQELRRNLMGLQRRTLISFGIAAAGGSGGQYLMFSALSTTTVAVATTLRNVSPWATMLIGAVYLGSRDRITVRLTFSTVLMMVGVGLIIFR